MLCDDEYVHVQFSLSKQLDFRIANSQSTLLKRVVLAMYADLPNTRQHTTFLLKCLSYFIGGEYFFQLEISTSAQTSRAEQLCRYKSLEYKFCKLKQFIFGSKLLLFHLNFTRDTKLGNNFLNNFNSFAMWINYFL